MARFSGAIDSKVFRPAEINARRTAVGAVLLTGANLFSRATFAVIGIWLTGYLGPAEAGLFFAAYAFLGLFAAVPDFGMGPLIVREAARRPEDTPVFYGSGLAFFSVSGLATYLVMVGSAAALHYDRVTLAVIAVLGLTVVGKASEAVSSTILQLRQELHLAAILQFLIACASILLIYFGVQAGADLLGVSWILAGTAAGSAIAMLVLGLSKCRPRFLWGTLRGMAKETYWFALSGFLANFYLWGGAIVLSKLASGEAEVGQYAAAFRIVSMIYLVPFVLFNQVFPPMMFAWAKSDPPRLHQMYRRLTRHAFALATGMAVGLFVLAEPVTVLLYGEDFRPGAAALRLLAWALPLRFLASSSGAILTATDRLPLKSALQAALVVLTLVLSLFLIPPYGYRGAAIAVLATEAALAALYWVGARHGGYALGLIRDLSLVRVVAASAATGLLVYSLGGVAPVWAAASLGGGAYVVLLVALGYFDAEDRHTLRILLTKSV